MARLPAGDRVKVVAQRYNLDPRTVERWHLYQREEGHVLPHPIHGRPRKLDGALDQRWAQQGDQHPQRLAQDQQVQVSRQMVGRALVRCARGEREQKTLYASERDEAVRYAWRTAMRPQPADDLVLVDESSTHVAMTPLSARTPRGEHAYGAVPRNKGAGISLLAALSTNGVSAAMTLPGGRCLGRSMAWPSTAPANTSCRPSGLADKRW